MKSLAGSLQVVPNPVGTSTLHIAFSKEIVKQGFLLCGVYNGKTSLGDTACGVNSIFLKIYTIHNFLNKFSNNNFLLFEFRQNQSAENFVDCSENAKFTVDLLDFLGFLKPKVV